MDSVKRKSEEIELIERKEFYPYPYGTCGGDTYKIYVFKATKKGEYTIEFSSKTITVKCI